ncbi:hypothetical protein I312_100428 [Cryptococcus bacillisporus CA1280]|uniref:uncharacterized protein n=1 Tax=Cryptococcus bacillisporus CA1280 TaxID=1296109 RepID=UPI003369569E
MWIDFFSTEERLLGLGLPAVKERRPLLAAGSSTASAQSLAFYFVVVLISPIANHYCGGSRKVRDTLCDELSLIIMAIMTMDTNQAEGRAVGSWFALGGMVCCPCDLYDVIFLESHIELQLRAGRSSLDSGSHSQGTCTLAGVHVRSNITGKGMYKLEGLRCSKIMRGLNH